MYILGLSALTHDPAAALLGENGVEAAIEESKLVRLRTSGGIPRAAIRLCLGRAGIGWGDLSCVAVASRPLRAWQRQAWLRGKLALVAPMASGYYQAKALGELGRELNNFRILKLMRESAGCPVLALDHHLCHAASTFYASPFDRALILTMDERGDGIPALVALGERNRIRVLGSVSFPHSLAWIYSQVTGLLGFVPGQEEHKTQWLSLEGDPVFQDLFLEMFHRGSSLLPRLDFSFFTRGVAGRVAFSKKFYRRVGIDPAAAPQLGDTLRRQLARSVQRACTTLVTHVVENYRQRTGARHLCLAGGLFLNALLVADVEKSTGFDHVFVQPAAGNPGCAPGAAWWVWHQVLGKPRQEAISHLYWGPAYSNSEIKQVLENCKSVYRWCDTDERKIEEGVRLLEAGKIVAWYQGAAEFGPRALGNRSLLASPWAPYVQDNLNQYVKRREAFRPFAIAVPDDDCAKYFRCSALGRFMSTLAEARPEGAELLREFLLPGGRVRLHVVERRANPLFWQLLKKFGEQARAPMLINTSFNLFGEPAVITPREAVGSFFCSGVDALVMNNFLLTKS